MVLLLDVGGGFVALVLDCSFWGEGGLNKRSIGGLAFTEWIVLVWGLGCLLIL